MKEHVVCDQFIYAQFNSVGYRLIKSCRVDRFLDNDDILYLCHMGVPVKDKSKVQVYFPDMRLYSFSYLERTKDEYDRPSLWNHTILVTKENFKQLNESIDALDPYFVKPLPVPPASLPLIKIPCEVLEDEN